METINHSNIGNLIVPDLAFTHSGKFHADDVFSAALLTYINPQITISRGNNIPDNFTGLIFDIGGGEFDHHQNDKRHREDGTPYAAFGLLWEKYGDQLINQEDAKRFEADFVQPLDICDNTGCHNLIAGLISDFNPSWDSEDDIDEAFHKAKLFALTILENRIEAMKSVKRAEGMVKEALGKMKDNILILPQSAPWKAFIKETSAEFVIYPSNRGGYNAQGVPSQEEDNMNRLKISFPEEWAGLREEELEAVSRIKGLRFCHSSKFLVASDTIEGAINACKKAKYSSK